MQETGSDRIQILLELLAFSENCITQQFKSSYPEATESDIQENLNTWYAGSEHFNDRTVWPVRERLRQ